MRAREHTWRFALLGCSFVMLVWAVQLVPTNTRSFQMYFHSSDHVSHTSTAILFFYRSFSLYTTPIYKTCNIRNTPSHRAFARRIGIPLMDVCNIRERRGKRPLVINWQAHPKPYPPGLHLLMIPEALLYEFTSTSIRTISFVTIAKVLLFAHVLVFAMWWFLFGVPRREEEPEPSDDQSDTKAPEWGLGFVLIGLFGFEVMVHSVNGFYDPIAILCIVFAIAMWQRQRPIHSLFWYGLALFLHYRALWYLPLFPLAVWQLWQARKAHSWERKQVLQLSLIGLLYALAGLTFLMLLGSLRGFQQNSPILFGKYSLLHQPYWGVSIPVLMLMWVFLVRREWILSSFVGWHLFMLFQTPQIQKWHVLFVWPLMLLTRREKPSADLMLLMVIFLWVESAYVFKVFPFYGGLVSRLSMLFFGIKG